MPQDGVAPALPIPDSPAPPNAFLKPFGRPSTYTPAIGAKICELIERGWKMRQIEQREDMPAAGLVYSWLKQHSDFREQFNRAREDSVEALADEIVEIADTCESVIYHDGRPIPNNAAVKAAELRVGARQWLMGKWSKRYQDKQQVEISGTITHELQSRMDEIQARRDRERGLIDVTPSVQPALEQQADKPK